MTEKVSQSKTLSFSLIFRMKKKGKATVIAASEDFPDEAVSMEPGKSRERQTAWETVT